MGLTPAEARLLAFILIALCVGAWVKHHRQIEREKAAVQAPLSQPLTPANAP